MPLNCLLVDDSEAFLASAARLLAAQGARVVGSRHRRRRRPAARRRPCLPDIALVDLELGAADGIEELARQAEPRPGLAGTSILISLRATAANLAERIAGSGARRAPAQGPASACRALAEILDEPGPGPADLAEAWALRRVATLIAPGRGVRSPSSGRSPARPPTS